MKLDRQTSACSALVAARPDFGKGNKQKIFCTISPNPNTLHECYKTHQGKISKVKIPYGKLQQKVQYEYCHRILERCYVPFLSDDAIIIGTWELNKSGNVHFHFLIQDKIIHNPTQLAIFQRNVLNCEETIRNMSKGKKMVDYMNNIVYLTKPLKDIIKYMDKDYDDNKDIFPNYINLETFSKEIHTDVTGKSDLLKVSSTGAS